MKNLLRSIASLVMSVLLIAALAPAGQGSTNLHAAAASSAVKSPATAQAVDPEQLYHDAWQVIQDNFLHRDRLKDWSKWEHKYDGQLLTEDDATRAINTMLDSLKEDYTYYKSPGLVQHDKTRTAAKNVVNYKLLPGNIGYIQIKTFSSENTAAEVEAALKALSGAKSYILDLRGNGGGYVMQAFEVFSLFVDQGTFTTLKGHHKGAAYKEEYVVKAKHLENIENGTVTKYDRRPNLSGSKPLVILVDGDSASASEMLTGALKDCGRATVVGTKTFGKGIAQIAPALKNGGAVRVTFAEYFLPGGSSIHRKGITPDRVVNRGNSGDPQVAEALKVIDEKLK